MRILILTNSDLGLYKFRKELIEKLLEHGHSIYLSLPDGSYVRPFIEMGCCFIETPIDRRGIVPKTDLKLLFSYVKLIRSVDPDLLITYTIKPNIYGGIAARLAGKPYAANITGLGTAFEKTGIVRKVVVGLYRIALKKARFIFFENHSNCDELVSLKCCSKDRSVVLNGAGVNTELYQYQDYPRNEIPKFLFIGRVMKEKGIDELLAAMKKLTDNGHRCFLDVVGPLEENYTDRMKQCEGEGWLKYHGFMEDVRPFITDCDCFVLPSWHEGMANTNLECASMGRPVITSNIPGCKEAVIVGTSGLLCEPKNADNLYEVMKIMMESENRAEMGRAGRAYMEKKFDKKKVIDKTVSLLETVLN